MTNHPNRSRFTQSEIDRLTALATAPWRGEPLEESQRQEWDEAEHHWHAAIAAAVRKETEGRGSQATEDCLTEAARIEDEFGSTDQTDEIAELLGFIRVSGTHDYCFALDAIDDPPPV